MSSVQEGAWEAAFWRALEARFASIEQACAALAHGGERVSFRDFGAALETILGDDWPHPAAGNQADSERRQLANRAVFDSLMHQSANSGSAGFSASDMVRAHSSWRKRTASLERSAIDHAVTVPEPDALSKTNDIRIAHQLVKRDEVRPTPGKNTKWYYPQPSMEMEARRVLDFWRGQASRPWGSRQEAAQHFRRAFAFFDTRGAGRINYASFKAGIVRLRYGVGEALARQLFDKMDRRGSGLLTHADLAAPLYQPQPSWLQDTGMLPRAWLRHSRLTSFDTSRRPMREQTVNRRVHGRGDNVHDGLQHEVKGCRLPCCTTNRDATALFRNTGGQLVRQGYFGPSIHATWSAISEHVRGETNKFVSPAFRRFDVPVPALHDCVLPKHISADAPHAHLAPVNNYVSGDWEPWQAPTVRLSRHTLCPVCKGAGALTIEGLDLKSTLALKDEMVKTCAQRSKVLGGYQEDGHDGHGHGLPLRQMQQLEAADFEYVHPERQHECPACHGSGWALTSDHECIGHPPCRNHVDKCFSRLHAREGSMWHALEEGDPRLVQEASPELVVTVVQARNLPVRDRWKGHPSGVDAESATHQDFVKNRAAWRVAPRFQSCNAFCVVSLHASQGQVEEERGHRRTPMVKGSSYPVFNSCFSFALAGSKAQQASLAPAPQSLPSSSPTSTPPQAGELEADGGEEAETVDCIDTQVEAQEQAQAQPGVNVGELNCEQSSHGSDSDSEGDTTRQVGPSPPKPRLESEEDEEQALVLRGLLEPAEDRPGRTCKSPPLPPTAEPPHLLPAAKLAGQGGEEPLQVTDGMPVAATTGERDMQIEATGAAAQRAPASAAGNVDLSPAGKPLSSHPSTERAVAHMTADAAAAVVGAAGAGAGAEASKSTSPVPAARAQVPAAPHSPLGGTVIVQVWHRDSESGELAKVGQTAVNLSGLLGLKSSKSCEERWLTLTDSNGNLVRGNDVTGGEGWQAQAAHRQLPPPAGAGDAPPPDISGHHYGVASVHVRLQLAVSEHNLGIEVSRRQDELRRLVELDRRANQGNESAHESADKATADLPPSHAFASARRLATGCVAPHTSHALAESGTSRSPSSGKLHSHGNMRDCLACAALDEAQGGRLGSGVGDEAGARIPGVFSGETKTATALSNGSRVPHILELVVATNKAVAHAHAPGAHTPAAQLLKGGTEVPYSLQDVLDKAIVFFEHSIRNHHRHACGDDSGLAQANTHGAFAPETSVCRLLLHLDLDFDTHVDARTRRFKDAGFGRMLVRRLAEAADVDAQRVRLCGLMRGSILAEALIRPDPTGADYRSASQVIARVASCIRSEATPLCSLFQARKVRLVRSEDSWLRTVARLAAAPPPHAKGGGISFGPKAKVTAKTIRVHLAGVFFQNAQALGLGSLAIPATVKRFQTELRRELASQVSPEDLDQVEPRLRIGWPQPDGAVQSTPGTAAHDGGVFCDVDILPAGAFLAPGQQVSAAGSAAKSTAGRGPSPKNSLSPQEIVDMLVDKAVDTRLQQAGKILKHVPAIGGIEEVPTRRQHARYCQELFDHYRHPRSGKLMHGYGAFSYAALQAELEALQDRLSRLVAMRSDLVRVRLPPKPQVYQQKEPEYRRPGLLAPPPPPGIAPVELPVRIPAEPLAIPEFNGQAEEEPEYEEPVLEDTPRFEPPDPAPAPQLVLPNAPKDPPRPQPRPYPWQPVKLPAFDLPPLVLLPEPEFQHPTLEKLPVFQPPDMHTLPAIAHNVPWDVLIHRTLGRRPIFLLDLSGSMCDKDPLCPSCAGVPGRGTDGKTRRACTWISRMREAMLVVLREGGAASRCEAFDVIAFNFGALSLSGAPDHKPWRLGGDRVTLRAARKFVQSVTSDQWLGAWNSSPSMHASEPGEGQGVLFGASSLGAPSGGFRRGSSNLLAALRLALACADASEVYVLSDGKVNDGVRVLEQACSNRHLRQDTPRAIHSFAFGRSTAGHQLLQDLAQANQGLFLHYTEPCGAPARVRKAESGQAAQAARVETLSEQNAQAYVPAVADYAKRKNAVLQRNEEAFLRAREQHVEAVEAVRGINQARKAAWERVKAAKIAAAQKEYARRTADAFPAWRRAVAEYDSAGALVGGRAFQNLQEEQRYLHEKKRRQQMHEEKVDVARRQWVAACGQVEEANKDAYAVARAQWEKAKYKIERANAEKLETAASNYAKLCEGIRQRNRILQAELEAHEASVQQVQAENRRREEQVEIDFAAAMQRFEREVGGPEAAAELLAGKAAWRENKWAWREYVDMINTARITTEHLARLKRGVLEERAVLEAQASALTTADGATIGAAPWPAGRPNEGELLLGVRRELARALAEWVMAVEEVKIHNERIDKAARVRHKAEVQAMRRANAKWRKEAAHAHEADVEAARKHNAGVDMLLRSVDAASDELHKVTLALDVLQRSLVHSDGLPHAPAEADAQDKTHARGKWPKTRKVGDSIEWIRADGQARRMPAHKALVPPACLVELMRVAGGETEDALGDFVTQQADDEHCGKFLQRASGQEEGGRGEERGPRRSRAKSAPPPRGLRKYWHYLEHFDAADCHPVPAGVSSSGLRGGSGGAPRPALWRGEPRPYGYVCKNDVPNQGLLGSLLPRQPNRSARNAQDYIREHAYPDVPPSAPKAPKVARIARKAPL